MCRPVGHHDIHPGMHQPPRQRPVAVDRPDHGLDSPPPAFRQRGAARGPEVERGPVSQAAGNQIRPGEPGPACPFPGELGGVRQVSAHCQPHRHPRELPLDGGGHLGRPGRHHKSARPEQVERLPDHLACARGLLEIEMTGHPARQQPHDLAHQRHPVAGPLAQRRVRHRPDPPGARSPRPVIGNQPAVRGPPDVELHILSPRREHAAIRLVRPGQRHLAAAAVRRDRRGPAPWPVHDQPASASPPPGTATAPSPCYEPHRPARAAASPRRRAPAGGGPRLCHGCRGCRNLLRGRLRVEVRLGEQAGGRGRFGEQ